MSQNRLHRPGWGRRGDTGSLWKVAASLPSSLAFSGSRPFRGAGSLGTLSPHSQGAELRAPVTSLSLGRAQLCLVAVPGV